MELSRLKTFLILMVLLLSACSQAKSDSKETAAPPTPTEQPTLVWNDIQELGSSPPPPLPLLITDDRYPIQPSSDETGKQLYESYCAGCHGINGEGQQPDPYAPGAAPPHNADGHTWHHPDQQNFQTVWQGLQVNGVMPSFADRLSADEIIQILAYLKTWWKPHQLAEQVEQSRLIAEQ